MFLRFSDTGNVDTGDPMAELSPVEILRTPGADITVVACAGLLTHFGMPNKEFFRSFVDRGCNVVFLKDFRQCWYQRGLLSLSTNLSETVEVVQGLLPKGTRSVRTIGTSAGAFAALHLGIRMNADRVLAFAPQTRVLPGVFDRYASFDSRRHDIDFSSPDIDVRNSFAMNPDFAGRIDIHFGAKALPDVRQARAIEGYPQVHLHGHDFDKHGIAQHLRETGELDAVLGDFVS